jgi:prolyl-tRNA synthetase
MMNVYADFAENFLAIPVWKGTKSANERFAGAVETYCIEALMQDGKALQAGTSHFLGQNFAKAFDVKFTGQDGKQDYVWATSWGVSTRLMGALIMTHSDDNGLVLPPNLAPIKVAIVPIYRNDDEYKAVCDHARTIKSELEAKGISVKLDDRDTHKPGWKFAEYEFKGVPIRIAVGPRDIENGVVELARRDTLTKESTQRSGLAEHVDSLLKEIQRNLYQKALKHREENTTSVSTWNEFLTVLDTKGGFIIAHWDGSSETEQKIKEETKATIRLIPLEDKYKTKGTCVFSGRPSDQMVVFARSY